MTEQELKDKATAWADLKCHLGRGPEWIGAYFGFIEGFKYNQELQNQSVKEIKNK